MAKRRVKREPGRPGSEFIAAGEFKATCLELMDRVCESGTEYVVTKHGRPVAKLVPYESPERKPLFGALKGSVVKVERPYDPLDEKWEIDR
jgi:prevent-host-death family protein